MSGRKDLPVSNIRRDGKAVRGVSAGGEISPQGAPLARSMRTFPSEGENGQTNNTPAASRRVLIDADSGRSGLWPGRFDMLAFVLQLCYSIKNIPGPLLRSGLLFCQQGERGISVTQDKIQRINELARKSRDQGLTEEEKAEQQALRKEYVEAMKQSLKSQLDASVVIRPDGTSYRLTQKKK